MTLRIQSKFKLFQESPTVQIALVTRPVFQQSLASETLTFTSLGRSTGSPLPRSKSLRPVFQVKKKPCPPSPPFRDYWTTLGLARATEFYPLFALSVKKLTMNDSSFGITRELVSLVFWPKLNHRTLPPWTLFWTCRFQNC